MCLNMFNIAINKQKFINYVIDAYGLCGEPKDYAVFYQIISDRKNRNIRNVLNGSKITKRKYNEIQQAIKTLIGKKSVPPFLNDTDIIKFFN